MLTPETAAKIFNCHKEIKDSENLLLEMKKREKALNELKHGIEHEEFLKEKSYYNDGLLSMTIPSSENSGSVYRIEFELGRSILIAHIAKQKAMLVTLNEQARLEIEMEENNVTEKA
jgi:hypothetical protein